MTAVRTVLVTGASGVIGAALVPRLAPARVLALVHRHPCPDADGSVVGDITAPGLGLDTGVYAALAREVDAVVHCAARTSFASGWQATAEANVAGTRTVVQFAADAGATLYHVSTAFVARSQLTRRSRGHDSGVAAAHPEDYVDSKRAGEQVVAGSGTPAMIIRPSVVIGDSVTGHIGRFQGIHELSTVLLRNQLPLIPMPAQSRVDFLPSDVVARAIAALVFSGCDAGEAWITAGSAALTAADLADVAVATGAALGLDVRRPRMVSPDMVDRLIRPVFIDPLSPAARRRFDDLLAITALFTDAPVFPTTLGTLPLRPEPPSAVQLADAYRTSLLYLAHAKSMTRTLAGAGRAL